MRLKILKLLYLIFLFAIVGRLFYWQILQSDDLSAKAEMQHLSTVEIEAPRGEIYAVDGAPLAANKPTFLLYGLPKVVKSREEISLKLTEIVYPDKESVDLTGFLNFKLDIDTKLAQDLYWVALLRDLDFETKQKIEKLNLEGIGFEENLSRFYPESSSSAHLLGFVAANERGIPTGYFGLEGFYNKELKGVGGQQTEERDARGIPILSGKFNKQDAQSGHNLTLNINRSVQYIVEKKLKDGLIRYQAKSASVIVMDPKSGAILAMASYPNYDPNSFFDFPKDHFRNPNVAESYEPGSTFKVVVMAAAVNENLVKGDTRCDICSKPVEASGYLIRTWNNKYYPDTTMSEVIAHSDNTGMVYVARKLGFEKLYQYIQDFGFGSLTEIDLQDETTPALRDKKEWRDIDIATASFGQGVAITPIQLIRAVSAIANGGYLMQPQIVKSVESDDKTTIIKPKVIGQPISKEAASEVAQMMVDAVENGEAKRFAPKGYKIAGKSGTAQVPIAGHYDPEKTIASYVGFAPAYDPKFVILVRYENPSTVFGSGSAAPTFYEITKELLTYYNIPPGE